MPDTSDLSVRGLVRGLCLSCPLESMVPTSLFLISLLMLGMQWQLRPLLDPALEGPTVISRHLESLAKAGEGGDNWKERCGGGEVLRHLDPSEGSGRASWGKVIVLRLVG